LFLRYIGSTGVDGLHHLVWEVLDNCVDEALSGYASIITVTLNPDNSCTITDDGRGIPCDLHPSTGKSALETVLTVLHAGGKFENDGYKVSGGLHGVGISVVNALSEFTKVRVWRKSTIPKAENGVTGEDDKNKIKRHEMDFLRGIPQSDINVVKGIKPKDDIEFGLGLSTDSNVGEGSEKAVNADDKESLSKKKQKQLHQMEQTKLVKDLHSKRKTGTEVTFLPDIQVFKGENGKPGIEFDIERLKSRMDEIAYLNAGLTLTLFDNREHASKKMKANAGKLIIYNHPGGLSEYMELLCQTKTPLFGLNAPKSKKKDGTKKKATKRTIKKKALPENHPLQSLLSPDQSTILCLGSADTVNGPVSATIALRYSSDQYNEIIYSFVNNIRTKDGGTHVEGLKACLTRTVNSCAKRLKKLKGDGSNLPGEFVREGLTAILSVSVQDPEFEGQTKGRLGNPGKFLSVINDPLVTMRMINGRTWNKKVLFIICTLFHSLNSVRWHNNIIPRTSCLTKVLYYISQDCGNISYTQTEIYEYSILYSCAILWTDTLSFEIFIHRGSHSN